MLWFIRKPSKNFQNILNTLHFNSTRLTHHNYCSSTLLIKNILQQFYQLSLSFPILYPLPFSSSLISIKITVLGVSGERPRGKNVKMAARKKAKRSSCARQQLNLDSHTCTDNTKKEVGAHPFIFSFFCSRASQKTHTRSSFLPTKFTSGGLPPPFTPPL